MARPGVAAGVAFLAALAAGGVARADGRAAAARKALEDVALRHGVDRVEADGDVLVVTLSARERHSKDALAKAVQDDAAAAGPAMLRAEPTWSAVRLVFQHEWRDRSDASERRPHLVATLDRASYAGDTAPEAVWRRFRTERVTHADWDLWTADRHESERRRRLQILRSRAAEWASASNQLTYGCQTCGARGIVRGRVCPTCRGRTWVVHRGNFKKVCYDMKSPAWRRLPDAEARCEAEYREALEGRKPIRRTGFAVRTTELTGERHGVVRLRMGGDTEELRFVWYGASDGGSANWYLYSEEADGPWPTGEEAGGDEGTLPLEPAERAAVEDALDAADLAHDVRAIRRRGDVVVVTLASDLPPARPGISPTMAEDAVRATRAILIRLPRWAGVRIVFLAWWRDRFGEVAEDRLEALEIDRATFEKIKFETLSLEEVIALYARESADPAGRILWPQGPPK